MAKKHAEELGRRDPSNRRLRVLDEARRRFAESGYEATSVNEIAAAAGVSVGALYKYFPDKPALLEAVLAGYETAFVDAISGAGIQDGPHIDRIQPMMKALFRLAGTNEHFFWSLTSGTHGLRGRREHSPGNAMRRVFADFIESGIAAREFRNVDVPKTAALAFGVVESAMRQWIATGATDGDRKTWTRLVSDVLTRALER